MGAVKTCLLLMYFLCYYLFCQGTVTQSPATACAEERIIVSCDLTPPSGDTFQSLTPRFIVGNAPTSYSDMEINDNASHPEVDLSRLTAFTPIGGTTLRVTGTITLLSYNTTTDDGLRLGCTVQYLDTSTSSLEFLTETLQLNQSAPPSAPSLQSSVSYFNTATCSADISLSWNTPPSNRTVDRYFLYLDGSPLATTNSNSYNHSTILNINTNYQYSVTAMSCAGNSSTSSSNVNSVKSYSLIKSSQNVFLDFNNVTRNLTFNWELSAPTQPSGVSGLDITYSLQLLYSHSRQGVTYPYTDSTSFTLPSSRLSYNTNITAHNFTQLDGVETNITANLMIVQQCGQSFNGTAMEYFFNSNNPTTTPANSSTATTTSISLNTTISTLTSTTAIPTAASILPNGTDTSNILPVIIGCVVAAVVLLLILIIIIILIVLLIIFLRKREENKEHTGADGSDVKKYQGLEEDTYSQVNKKPKSNPKPVKKDENELTYLEIDHSSGTGKIVKPPTIPKTNYADITDFPQETQYASMQT